MNNITWQKVDRMGTLHANTCKSYLMTVINFVLVRSPPLSLYLAEIYVLRRIYIRLALCECLCEYHFALKRIFDRICYYVRY